MINKEYKAYTNNLKAMFLLSLIFILYSSCKEKAELITETPDGRHLVYIEITTPMGSPSIDANHPYLPSIYNRGVVSVGDTSIQAILIGKQETKGEKLKSHLIGGFSKPKGGSQSYTLLLQTLNKKYDLPIQNFEDFAITYPSVKQMIELYENHKNGSSDQPKIEWISTIKSLRILQQLEQKSAQ